MSKRRDYKRSIAQAYYAVERAMLELAQVRQIVASSHLELAEMLDNAGVGLALCQQAMLDFWYQAWGEPPDDLSGYL